MAAQEELTCVSCESTFDAGPNGGFCPDCDTPHPDYGMRDGVDDDASPSESGEQTSDAVDDSVESDDEPSGDDDQMAENDDSEPESDPEGATDDSEPADEPDGHECSSCGSSVDASASFCPNCGSEIDADEEPESESSDLTECPGCSNSVTDESFCPNCGTDLDAVREAGGEVDADEATDAADADSADDGDAVEAVEAEDSEEDDAAKTDEEAEADDADDGDEAEDDDAVPESVTLVIEGESYPLGDGDTFGRQDEIWLDDLVAASGGRDEASFISGEHLEFEITDDGVYVTDCSTNGTSHNGEDLDGGRAKLEDGDTLELAGRAEITVQL